MRTSSLPGRSTRSRSPRRCSRMGGWLAPGGRLHVVVQNAESLHRRIGHALGRLPSLTHLTEKSLASGHKRVYTKSALLQEIEAAGYEILECEGFLLKPFDYDSLSRLDGPWSMNCFRRFCGRPRRAGRVVLPTLRSGECESVMTTHSTLIPGLLAPSPTVAPPSDSGQLGPGKLSLVIPVFNEEENLPEIFKRLRPVEAGLEGVRGLSVEIVIVDDHSHDSTPQIVKSLAATRPERGLFASGSQFGGPSGVCRRHGALHGGRGHHPGGRLAGPARDRAGTGCGVVCRARCGLGRESRS